MKKVGVRLWRICWLGRMFQNLPPESSGNEQEAKGAELPRGNMDSDVLDALGHLRGRCTGPWASGVPHLHRVGRLLCSDTTLLSAICFQMTCRFTHNCLLIEN